MPPEKPEEMSRDEQALFRTRHVPYNRRTRKQIAKNAHVDFSNVNRGMLRQSGVYLGIKEFKRSIAGLPKKERTKLIRQYKENAHRSYDELMTRRALENAKIEKPKEIKKGLMKRLLRRKK